METELPTVPLPEYWYMTLGKSLHFRTSVSLGKNPVMVKLLTLLKWTSNSSQVNTTTKKPPRQMTEKWLSQALLGFLGSSSCPSGKPLGQLRVANKNLLAPPLLGRPYLLQTVDSRSGSRPRRKRKGLLEDAGPTHRFTHPN